MPYLVHDCGASTLCSQQRTPSQSHATATRELVGLVASVKPEIAQERFNKIAGRRDPLEVLRNITRAELELSMTSNQAVRLLAAVELGRLVFGSQPVPKTITEPKEAADAFSYDLSFHSKERFAVLVLDVKHKLICSEIVSVGTATEVLAHPREVFSAVLKAGGTRCIVGHNHPSGNVQPSPSDLELTRELLQAGKTLGVPVLDHLILGQGQFSSIRESTTLWEEIPQDD